MPAAPIVPDDLRTKLLRIRALVLDVDGVLTDGTLTFDEEGRELKSFDVKDGLGLVLLRDLGYRIGIISSRSSKVVAQRCRDLKIPDECILQGELDKAAAFDRLVGRWGLESYEAVAVGDDLPDLGMMRRAGVGACPSDAVSIVKDAAALHLTKPGGRRRRARALRPDPRDPPRRPGRQAAGSPSRAAVVRRFRRPVPGVARVGPSVRRCGRRPPPPRGGGVRATSAETGPPGSPQPAGEDLPRLRKSQARPIPSR